MSELRKIFEESITRESMKWENYFEIYERHIRRFVGSNPTVLEIGVYAGGSLQMWRRYLGDDAIIVGMDTDPRCAEMRSEGFDIFIGEQGNKDHLQQIIDRYGSFDIVIDDGSHKTSDLKASFEKLFPYVTENGVYLVEDIHTNYWAKHEGGYKNPGTFIEMMKSTVDHLNAFHSRDPNSFRPNFLTHTVNGLHFYDSVVVLEKRTREAPFQQVTVNTQKE
ncbi:MAG: class I SAM-dependent methyltransferase [Rhodospirillaceae bacterium]|nr:class I SAM-dependent methyltransferase [Rhodospirillaceae bacterium]